MDDIIMSIPWQCGEKYCASQWHLANYWIYIRGVRSSYSVDSYSDGDHEDIRASDLPTSAECCEAWREYAQHVVDTGTDPINNYVIRREIVRHERWLVKWTPTVAASIWHFKRNGKEVSPKEVPDHVREYLNIPDKSERRSSLTCEELEQVGKKAGVWHTEIIEAHYPRSEMSITRELRSAARRDLATRRKLSKHLAERKG